jgi:hypothetical protein
MNDCRITSGNLLLDDDQQGNLTLGRYSTGNHSAFIKCSTTCSDINIRTPDNGGGFMIANTVFTADKPIDLTSGAVLKVAGNQVVGARKTGWAVDTGTAKRTANATYSGTAEAGYTQATVQALMDAVRDLSQTVKALKDDLHGTAGHGLIGT